MFICYGWPVENTGLDFRRPKGAEKSIFDTNTDHDDEAEDEDDEGGDVIKKNRKERSKSLLL